MRIGYHASHEQFPPSELLQYVIEAERAGFNAAMCSEHLFPWSEAQGHSGFAFSWLGAAMQATSLPFGLVTAPGYRYHPTVTAHALATLQEMFPGRAWVALGSGEALNEHVIGERWPSKSERNERLRECADIIRRLWNGEWVTHRGHVTVAEAHLWSLPPEPPRMVAAAITAETAAWAGSWADALITVTRERDEMKKVIDAFRSNGGKSKPVLLQVKVSWDVSDDVALDGARDQWATNVFPSSVAADLSLPHQFEVLAQTVSDEQLRSAIRIGTDLDDHLELLRQDLRMGIDEIYIHNVSRNQSGFIEAFGTGVLPRLHEEAKKS